MDAFLKRLMPVGFAGLVFAAVVAVSGAVAGPGLVEPKGAGEIDWVRGTITASGLAVAPAEVTSPAQARLMAFRAAKVDAQRNLLEIAQSVRVASGTVIGDFMQVSDRVTTAVNGVVKGAVVLEETLDTSVEGAGTAIVRLRMPVWGNISRDLYDYLVTHALPRKEYPVYQPTRDRYPEWTGTVRHALLRFWLPSEAHADAPGPGSLQAPPVAPGTKTGIILDLTDIQVKPELYPTITDEKGQALVSPKLVDRGMAVEKGIVSYAGSVEEAKKSPRAGDDPLVLKALNFVAGTEAGLKVKLADAQGLDTASKSLKHPDDVFKNGITVAYRVTW